MHFRLLPDYEEALPTIARWYLDEWGREEEGDLETFTNHIKKKYLNSREIPMIICGIENGDLVAVCRLKFHEMAEYPDYVHWLGGVYTSAEHRRRGLGSEIVGHAIGVSLEHNVEVLYLQTEDLTGGIYKNLGWEPIERTKTKRAEVLVMKRLITA